MLLVCGVTIGMPEAADTGGAAFGRSFMDLARSPSLKHNPGFNRDSFRDAHVEITTLKSKLPQDAVHALAQEVVQRLAERAVSGIPASAEPVAEAIETLCEALVSDDADAAGRLIAQVRSDGVSLEAALLAYLAAAARRLGAWWDEDRVSFTEVTIGASRIYAIMRGLRHVIAPVNRANGYRAVFASVPDETHTLGITMAADLFRQKGWGIDLKVGSSHDALVADMRRSDCLLIGLSASGPRSLVALARLIVALRITNPAALILVSGQIVSDEADRVRLLGADAVAWDMPSAVSEMQRLADRLGGIATARH